MFMIYNLNKIACVNFAITIFLTKELDGIQL